MIAPFASVSVNGLARPSILRDRAVVFDDRAGQPRARSASTIRQMPVGNDTNAPCAARGCGEANSARSTLPCDRSASTSRGKQRVHRQPLDITGVNAGQQRFGEIPQRPRRRNAGG